LLIGALEGEPVGVVDVQTTRDGSHSKCRALDGQLNIKNSRDDEKTCLLNPGHGADRVVAVGEVAETVNGCVVCGPEINAAAEADAEDVCTRPIDEVKIKVFCKFWGVEDAIGRLTDVAELAAGALKELSALCADGTHGVCRIGGCIEATGGGGGSGGGGRVVSKEAATGGCGRGCTCRGKRRRGTRGRRGTIVFWRSDLCMQYGVEEGICLL
jgi:hypothetical protein